MKTHRPLSLSEIQDAGEPNLMIERMLNKNQSMEQHSARINNLTETLTECENEIRRLSREQSENAWTVKKLDAIEIFNNMEEIMYEILDNVIGTEVSLEIVKDNGKRKRSYDQEGVFE